MLTHPSAKRGRTIGRIVLHVLLCVLLFLAARSQASDHKAYQTVPIEPIAAITISQCSKLVGVIIVMTNGTLYPLPLENLTLEQVLRILNRVKDDSEHRVNADVVCKQES